MFRKKFPFYKQLDSKDCGPSCIRMIARFYGKEFTLQSLRKMGNMSREGVSLTGISNIAESIGFTSLAVKVDYEKMLREAPLPLIAHWNQNHFVVVYKITPSKVYVADPSFGRLTYTREEFLRGWITSVKHNKEQGILLLLNPTPDFYAAEGSRTSNKASIRYIARYVLQYKKQLLQVSLGLLLGSLLQLVFPVLTQSVIDNGIGNRQINFVYLILIAQLVLIAGMVGVEYIRAMILVHVSSRVNMQIIADFLSKLMRLPISFFDTKLTGDLTQRIRDHKRIEDFFTDSVLTIIFSSFSLLVLGTMLAFYHPGIFLVFLATAVIQVMWAMRALKKRRYLSNKLFSRLTTEQNNIIELINGMQEIKLNNIESSRRWQWQRIQAAIFRTNIKVVSLKQFQFGGMRLIAQVQIILVTFICALAVINGQMTIGVMMAVMYILGQISAPLNDVVDFIYAAQDAKISLERLGEIHLRDDEEEKDDDSKLSKLPPNPSLWFRNLSFHYPGQEKIQVLRNISLHIPEGKITAIVGASGSGKTTLLKLLLKFYAPIEGGIYVGSEPLDNMQSAFWRSECGVVMQDGFIFADTIANNIALKEPVDKQKLLQAAHVANIHEFIMSLPGEYNTRIGQDGIGLSEGQKQRLLIARAVYKNPRYIFFDEATNALDANNERVIMRNLEAFFKGRTVVIVAHRLSTVKNADQIVVLDRGEIVESGVHEELAARRQSYYTLVKNQLELGN
jgi:ATP-binding cassette, subfamily B, bacterial